jgi:hypothetical protein
VARSPGRICPGSNGVSGCQYFVCLHCLRLSEPEIGDPQIREIRNHLPQVTLLLIFGFAIGPSGLDFISPSEGKWFSIVADMALIMIGFLLGEKLTLSSLHEHGKIVLWLSIAEVVGTALVVVVGIGLGIPMDYPTGRIKPGEPSRVEALRRRSSIGG